MLFIYNIVYTTRACVLNNGLILLHKPRISYSSTRNIIFITVTLYFFSRYVNVVILICGTTKVYF